VTTPGGQTVVVQALDLDGTGAGGDQQVGGGVPSLDGALRAVQDLSAGLRKVVDGVSPRKATVEFSMAFAMESGRLTALFVAGKTEGSVTVTLEWGEG